MRQLRVVGLGDDHETVILEDPIRHERFAVSGDERLRAAARGDVRRLGQMEIEITSPLRPRDIQARVRAGESVDDVAAAGGVSAAHVERFAYPVLLERARVAEIARRAHPLLPGDAARTDERTLGEIVAATFAARGQDLDDGRWDASKAEGASWIVTLSWQAGRSDNVARWAFKPGAAGGTVDPRDDPARELLGQEPTAGPRRVEKPEDPEAGDGPATRDGTLHDALDEALEQTPAMAASGDIAPRRPTGSGHGSAGHASTGHASTGHASTGHASSGQGTGQGSRRPERGAARRGGRSARPAMPPTSASPRAASSGGEQVPVPRAGQRDETDAPAVDPGPAAAEVATPTTDPGEGSRRGRRAHPIVPSWEDVLLGTRSPRT
ncbi:septation protein SepH [Actinomycetospora sp. NBC_00405]|uniref:septation protein SepH n=1 Tax=Actinomycetospora sp. NBC_00405 TaxID=2975952 RepID=UPI002E1C2692